MEELDEIQKGMQFEENRDYFMDEEPYRQSDEDRFAEQQEILAKEIQKAKQGTEWKKVAGLRERFYGGMEEYLVDDGEGEEDNQWSGREDEEDAHENVDGMTKSKTRSNNLPKRRTAQEMRELARRGFVFKQGPKGEVMRRRSKSEHIGTRKSLIGNEWATRKQTRVDSPEIRGSYTTPGRLSRIVPENTLFDEGMKEWEDQDIDALEEMENIKTERETRRDEDEWRGERAPWTSETSPVRSLDNEQYEELREELFDSERITDEVMDRAISMAKINLGRKLTSMEWNELYDAMKRMVRHEPEVLVFRGTSGGRESHALDEDLDGGPIRHLRNPFGNRNRRYK